MHIEIISAPQIFLVLVFSVVDSQTGTRSGNEQVMKPIIMINKAIQFVKG
jgi:hypothetical protein